ILGATNVDLPTYKAAFLAMLRRFHRAGVEELSGHELYALCDDELAAADAWLDRAKLGGLIADGAASARAGNVDAVFQRAFDRFADTWQEEAGIATYGEAVADVMAFRASEGEPLPMARAEWLDFAGRASFYEVRARAAAMGIRVRWDCEHAKTPDGYYQVRG